MLSQPRPQRSPQPSLSQVPRLLQPSSRSADEVHWNKIDRIREEVAKGRTIFNGEDVQALLHHIDTKMGADRDDIPGWARKLIWRWRRIDVEGHDYFATELEKAAKGRR